MYLTATQCCGTQEISGLANHLTPEAAMKAFCEKAFANGGAQRYGVKPSIIPVMYSHYTFTAAIYDKDCPTWNKAYKDHKSTVDGLYKPYGHQFAAFIEKMGFGKVTTTEAAFNKVAHPDHKVQAWIWTPDPKAIHEWWQEFNIENELKKAKANLDQTATYKKQYDVTFAEAEKNYEALKAKFEARKDVAGTLPEPRKKRVIKARVVKPKNEIVIPGAAVFGPFDSSSSFHIEVLGGLNG